MTRQEATSHRQALADAFRTIRATGAIALERCGITVSAGWEDMREAFEAKGVSPPNGLFWTKQGHDFSSDGTLLSDLHLQWVGDGDAFCAALAAQGLDVVRPVDEDQTIIVKSTPMPGAPKAQPLGGPLLDAVVADPASDIPRVALGHALRERGDPRGEFVLLHHEFATKGKLSKAKRKQLRELHLMYEQCFCPAHVQLSGGDFGQRTYDEYIQTTFETTYRSGFLHSATTPGAVLQWDPEAQAPRVVSPAPDIDFRGPLWATVAEIAASDHKHLRALTQSPVAARIKRLKASAALLAELGPADWPAVEAIYIEDDGPLDWLRQWGQVREVHLTAPQAHQRALDAAAGTSVRCVTFARHHGMTYHREGSGPFTRLTTGQRWPWAHPDLSTALDQESHRISRSVTEVHVGRVRDFAETHHSRSIAKELGQIRAMFQQILPDAKLTFAAKK